MKDNRAMTFLEKQLLLATEREKEHLKLIRRQTEQIEQQTKQIHQMSVQIDRFSVQLAEQTKTIQSLEEALLKKSKDLTSLSGKNRGLSKLLTGNASEKQTPVEQAGRTGQ